MNIQQAFQTCFRKYTDFTGRASRPEYWWFILAYMVIAVVAALIHRFVYGAVVLVFIAPLLAVGARRLHDVGKSGWFLLLALIPVIGNLILLYFMVQPSQPETNEFGAPPAQLPQLA